jgi:hypothetical protein
MSLTFKQFSSYMEAPLTEDDHLNEIWGFKNKAQADLARREKLRLLAKRGDLKAKKELDDIAHARTARNAMQARKDSEFNSARDHVEADERGSSRRYDAETGSVRRPPKRVYRDDVWGTNPA